jgi:hypothetical protein
VESAVVLDESQFSEFVHEKIHAGARGAGHLRQRLLNSAPGGNHTPRAATLSRGMKALQDSGRLSYQLPSRVNSLSLAGTENPGHVRSRRPTESGTRKRVPGCDR